jgi:hypothetical protein
MLRLAAEPISFLKVTAEVAASERLSPACLIRNVEMTRWRICKTRVRSSGWAANSKHSGIGCDLRSEEPITLTFKIRRKRKLGNAAG